jgi:hypothetical protein
MKHTLLAVAATAAAFIPARAETVKDREGAVRGDKARLEHSERWNYNDMEKGFAAARESGKPLLAVLRCVPCMACIGMDGAVLEDASLAPLLDQFVCVRVINANALDLARFQFDYDLSLSAMIFNADGAVYGRFGSWTHQKEPENKSLDSFKRALEAALAIHQGYPGNKAALAGKQGGTVPYQRPVDFPSLAAKYPSKLDWEGKVMQSCVHCHMVGDAFRAARREKEGRLTMELIYPHPSLETLGARLAADQVATIEAVIPGSASASAGLRAGDKIESLEGQPLISAADVSWVLHRAPDSGSLKLTLSRGGTKSEANLALAAGWRWGTDISRRAGTWPMRAMAFGGMKMEDLDDAAREQRGLGKNEMALLIQHVGQYGPHAAAKKEGFRKDDILVQAGDLKERITEGRIIGELLTKHRPGEKLAAVVIREGKRVELKLPQQ